MRCPPPGPLSFQLEGLWDTCTLQYTPLPTTHMHTHTELSRSALSDGKHRPMASDEFTPLLDLPGQAHGRQRPQRGPGQGSSPQGLANVLAACSQPDPPGAGTLPQDHKQKKNFYENWDPNLRSLHSAMQPSKPTN